jgi:hypothetical protein
MWRRLINNNNNNRTRSYKQMSKHRYDNENRTGPFNCANTKFTMNRSMHGIVETAVSCQDHIGLNIIDPIKTYAYQDITTTMKAYEKYEVLTFDFLYPNALFDLSSISTSLFQLQYTLPFRMTVRNLRQQRWRYPYSSIHIRGGDGPYKHLRGGDGPYKHQNWTKLFPAVLRQMEQHIVEFHRNNNSNNNTVLLPTKHTEASLSNSISVSTSHHYALLILSDLPGLRGRRPRDKVFQIWKREEEAVAESLLSDHGITLHIIVPTTSSAGTGTSDDHYYADRVNHLQAVTGSTEAGVYLDQLIVACADISFVGSSTEIGSTFQERIHLMRNQSSSSPC